MTEPEKYNNEKPLAFVVIYNKKTQNNSQK